MKNYVLIDPINKEYSGITSYSYVAYKLLKNICNTYLISRDNDETLYNFRQRIKNIIENNFSYCDTIIECPDTYNVLFYINKNYNIHVRLHGMKHIFDEINNNNIDINNYLNDLYQIQNCSYVSAPSNIIKSKTEKYISIKDVKVYPNPIPDYNFDINNKDIDILYIGRAQKNKGIDFLEPILSNFLDKKICLYGKEITNIKLKNKNINRIMHDPKEKNEILRRAKSIIIPSYIESFSQVAAEGISHGCQIITWDTVGISEYPGSMIQCINFGQIDKFIEAVKKSLSATPPAYEFEKYIVQNNEIYISEIRKIKSQRFFYNRPATTDIVFDIQKENTGMFKKKLKKLLRDPKQFWIDSKVNKNIISLFHNDKIKTNNTTSNIVCNDNCSNYIEQNTINFFSRIEKNQTINNHIGVNTHIKNGNINITQKPRNTIIFVNIQQCNNEFKIIEAIKKDCSSLNFTKNYFFEYLYKDSIAIDDEDIRNIINTFDKSFRDAISKFDIAIFIDPSTKIFSIFRAFFPDLKVIVILTDEYRYFDNILPTQIDTIIIHEKICTKINLSTFRRYFIYNSYKELCNYLDIYTNEISPRHHNMLLKIFGDVDFDTKYIDINTENINCIITINKCCTQHNIYFITWDEYIKYISQNIKSIMVAENVFFNYKELLLSSIKNNDWYTFLSLASYDGVRFEIYA